MGYRDFIDQSYSSTPIGGLLMPGENYGMPEQKSKFAGLLDDPLFQFGVGILANSQGNSFSTALGRGGLQATQNLNQRRQMTQQKQYQDLQAQEAQQRIQQNKQQQDAIARAIEKNPQLADAFQINPKAALNLAYPELARNSADPYTTIEYDDNGQAYLHNHRETDPSKAIVPLTVNGRPFIGAKNSPTLQGQISGAKSYNENLYSPTDMIDGVVAPKSLVAIQGGAPLPAGVKPTVQPSSPASFPRVTPQEQSMRDDKRMQILLGERDNQLKTTGQVDPYLQAEINGMAGRSSQPSGMGIRVPTKAQEAGATQNAKNASDLAYTPQIEAAKKTAGMTAEANTQAALDLPKVQAQAQETIKLIDDLIDHPGLSKSVGIMSYNPLNKVAGTDARDFSNRLDQIKGKQFLQAFEALKGGGAISEVEGETATDAIARMNTSSSEAEFRKAAQDFKDVINAGLIRAQERAKANPQQAQQTSNQASKPGIFDSMPKPNQYKGKIIRDDVTGKRYQSNGLQWKEIK